MGKSEVSPGILRAMPSSHRRGAYFNPNINPVKDTERVSIKTNYPRNKPCPCESGLKFKKCCLYKKPEVEQVAESEG